MKKLRNRFKNTIIGSLLLLCAIVSLAMMHLNAYATMIPAATATMSPTSQLDTPTPVATATTPPTATPTTPPTPTPTEAPTPTPTEAPTPTATPQPTPTPQQGPTTTPVLQPTPTSGTVSGTGGFPGAVPTSQPTTKPKSSPTATSTATMTPTPVASGSLPGDNQQNTGNNTTAQTSSSGFSPFIPVAAGSALFVLLGGLFGLAQLRKRKTQSSPLHNKPLSPVAFAATGTVSSWEPSQPNMFPSSDQRLILTSTVPPAAAMPSFPTMQQEAFADVTMLAQNPLMNSQSEVHNENTALAYTPSNLHPITMPLPKQSISGRPQKNPISIGDMSPLPLDSFDFSQIMSDQKYNDPQEAQPIPTPKANNARPVAMIQAPNVQDDPVLETIMRQAQMGLYALPGKDKKERMSTGSLSGIEKVDFLL